MFRQYNPNDLMSHEGCVCTVLKAGLITPDQAIKELLVKNKLNLNNEQINRLKHHYEVDYNSSSKDRQTHLNLIKDIEKKEGRSIFSQFVTIKTQCVSNQISTNKKHLTREEMRKKRCEYYEKKNNVPFFCCISNK